MATIKEAYCSFEVAKRLKEKGFDGETHTTFDKEGYTQPSITHQMALKWLREKGVHMSIDTVVSSDKNIYFNIDVYSEASGWCNPVNFYDSYEDAVEAALKYVLVNLI